MSHEDFDEWYQNLCILTYGEIDDEYILDSFRTILQWKQDSVFISEDIPYGKFTICEYWLLLSYLHECIDYGTSPRGAWLSDHGKEVLQYLNTYSNAEILEEKD